MKIKVFISILSIITAILISFTSYGQDPIDLNRIENVSEDTIQKIDQGLHKKMMDDAKVASDEAEEKAREAKRIEQDASEAAEQSKKALREEKKAQRARERANNQAKKAVKAREKSDQN